MIVQTEAYWNVYDAEAERETGPDNDVETYFAPNQKDQICLTINEREDFEVDEGEALDSDVLEQGVFDRLLTWIKDGQLIHKEAE